ncbi:PAS sensor protein [Methylobacterium sp. 4-46]|uniref:PAS domain-containing protein n=1 Tax=unclassified Methylobacterium TaxID=2615210 RepID=UPI000165C8F6|nr:MULTISPECIES: PAS domain-containing protein [Methylobacterium]ACA16941.1 PAS sensor protein [Methylobacterium sp. 4-46]WFT82627.1 PAS domain-containing protein [Methylobacterium nodulans]
MPPRAAPRGIVVAYPLTVHSPKASGPIDATFTPFTSDDFLQLIERWGLLGRWSWRFRGNEHYWSPAMYQILGLDRTERRPSYDLLYNLVDPADRAAMASPAEVVFLTYLADQQVRVIRPDRSVRVLLTRGQIYCGVDGRPSGAAGIVIDVTEQEMMRRARLEDHRRRMVLFEERSIWTHFSVYTRTRRVASQQLLALTGVTQDEFADDWTCTLIPEERDRLRDAVRARISEAKPFSVETHFRLARGGVQHFNGWFVPVWREDRTLDGWATLTHPAECGPPRATGRLREALEDGIEGRHLRAARALLDWSMTDLARTSGLSLSTIRRLEEETCSHGARSLHRALAALRAAGIVFTRLDAAIAVSKRD